MATQQAPAPAPRPARHRRSAPPTAHGWPAGATARPVRVPTDASVGRAVPRSCARGYGTPPVPGRVPGSVPGRVPVEYR